MQGFITFVREQGVVGLAVGFILGGAVSTVVKSLVEDIINPLIGLILGSTDGLKEMAISVGEASIGLGSFVATLIDFAIIAFVVYYIFKKLGLDKMDKKKS